MATTAATAPTITLPVIGYASARLTSRTFHLVRRVPLTGSGYAALCGVHIGTLMIFHAPGATVHGHLCLRCFKRW